MKKMSYFVMALALVLGFSQCKKEQIEPQNEGNVVNITLNVDGGASTGSATNGSKVVVDPPHVNFVEGDTILVASNGKYVGYLVHNGTAFSGDITSPTEGQPLYFYFLGNKIKVSTLTAGTTNECTVNISDQTGYPALPVISMAPSEETYPSDGNVYTASLHNKCSLMKFNVTTPSEAAICITGMNNKVTVDFANPTAENKGFSYSQTDDGVIKMAGGSGTEQNPAVKWAIVLPQEVVEAGEAYSDDHFYIGTRPAIEGGIGMNQFLNSGLELAVNTKVWYVDLGLPSGTLWATCNVGADAPEDYGDYFAWGETQPKDTYNWDTYQYRNGGDNGKLTKYCNNSDYGYNGFTDDLTTLLPEDDAATANWGSDWRMPTKEEWEELYNNTTRTWTTQNGVSGRLFTASNGNSLFLPAAGERFNSSLYDAGDGGYYRSSSLYTVPDFAWTFYFNSNSTYVDYGDRHIGRSVRAVRSPRQN